jgi:MFS family permease
VPRVRPLVAYLRSLNPRLSRDVWTLQAGGLANAFGNGVVLPFLIIYLHDVRGISLGLAGLVAATNSVAGLTSGFVAGTLVDRFGSRRVLVVALVVMTAGFASFPLIRQPWHAFALTAIAGCGSGAFWPSQASLLAALAPEGRRHAAFAQQRITMNLGVGLGGLVGGLIARTGDPSSFTTLFAIDAATFLLFALVLSRVRSPPRTVAPKERRGGYRDVVRDRAFVGVGLLNVAVIAAGIAPLVELFPAFAKDQARVPERGIGLIYFVNTVVIVLAQLPMVKLLEGRSRMRTIAAVGVIWAVSWTIVDVGGATLSGAAATAIFAGALSLFAIGECLQGAVQQPIVADLAPPDLVGRYMALNSLTWQTAFIIGPAAGGFVLGAEPFALWPICAAVCLGAAAYALALERRLPERVRRTPHAAPEAVAPALAEGMAAGSSG